MRTPQNLVPSGTYTDMNANADGGGSACTFAEAGNPADSQHT